VKSPTSKGAPAPNSPFAPPPDRLVRAALPAETVALAQALIGTILVRRLDDGERIAGRIVETEAYGLDDPASHAYRGPTRRNASMFLAHAHAYVYLIYGTSYCFNVVSEGAGTGAAVLVRAAEPLLGLERMRELRGRPGLPDHELARGPGNLARAFAIGPALNGIDLEVDDRLWLAPGGERPPIGASVRIGLTKAADRPHRWYARRNRAVSGQRSLSP
jgi:DNA-3-methyladenine glycosylase